MRRALKIAGAVVGVLIVAVVALLVGTFAGRPGVPEGRDLPGGSRLVKDGYVAAFVIPVGEGTVALVDCGNDHDAKALLAELARRNVRPENVVAIFLTHGHPDHVAGCHAFTKAVVYAMGSEADLLEGKAARRSPISWVMPRKDSGVRIGKPLRDGDVVQVGTATVTAYEVPGHTRGSAAYLSSSVLYLGDSADAKKDGSMQGAVWLFSDDTSQNKASLSALARRLETQDVKALAFAHTGVLEGATALRALAK